MADESGITDADWESVAKNLLRGQLMTKGLSYAKLAEAMAGIGVEETEVSIKNKVGRGRFTFMFFLQAMTAIGTSRILLPTLAELQQGHGVGQGGAQTFAKKVSPSDTD
ncbi:MAG: hypothetical protein K2W81_08020 [Sphingomonas sp.]|uniref:DUF6471 domain-containing protein n=1 Tax=Sphingomonas sp. TaxID=28214 RepID=UPI0026003161|nr:DUF6471 domain-containing protein [Sphingomonas sp.]MBY0283895.1 hypothetical protein [Sphingomonas sp.]